MEKQQILNNIEKIRKAVDSEQKQREWNMNESEDNYVDRLNTIITDLLTMADTDLEINWELSSSSGDSLEINLDLLTEMDESRYESDSDDVHYAMQTLEAEIRNSIDDNYYTIEYCSVCQDKTVCKQSPAEYSMHKNNTDYCRYCGYRNSQWKSIPITSKNVEEYADLIKESRHAKELKEIYSDCLE